MPTRPLVETTDDIRRELARCADPVNGLRYWLPTYGTIEEPGRGAIPFELWDCHQQVLDALERYKLLIILKSRQIGMSWLLGVAYPLWLALFSPSTLCLLFSRSESDAQELIRHSLFLYNNLPEWMRAASPIGSQNRQAIEFSGMNSRILAFSSAPAAGSGYTANYAFADEHAKQEYAAEQYTSIRPTIDMGGQFVSVSTAWGTGNFYHRLWTGAPLNGFSKLFFPYEARPGRDQDWWESNRATFPIESDFYREYPRTPEEAFSSSVTRPLNANHLVPTASVTTPVEESKSPFLSRLLKLRARRGEAGFRLYQEPKEKYHYVLGADVAEGFAAGDAQAAIVLCRETGEEQAVLHGRWPIEEYSVYLDLLAQSFRVLFCFERNNHGNALAVYMTQHMHRRAKQRGEDHLAYTMYHEKQIVSAQGAEVRPQLPGWLTTARSKPLMFTDLSESFASADIRLASGLVLAELKGLVINEKGAIGAPEGEHDDLAMAVAIAWQMIKRSPGPQPRPKTPYHMGPQGPVLRANAPRVVVGGQAGSSLLVQSGLVLDPAKRRAPPRPRPYLTRPHAGYDVPSW